MIPCFVITLQSMLLVAAVRRSISTQAWSQASWGQHREADAGLPHLRACACLGAPFCPRTTRSAKALSLPQVSTPALTPCTPRSCKHPFQYPESLCLSKTLFLHFFSFPVSLLLKTRTLGSVRILCVHLNEISPIQNNREGKIKIILDFDWIFEPLLLGGNILAVKACLTTHTLLY